MTARNVFCCAIALTAIAATVPLRAWELPPDRDQQRQEARTERESDLYDQGTDAIDEQDWRTAARAFERAADMKGTHADAALYWLAYARNKMGMRSEALSTLVQLKTNYAKSRWMNDAQKLELEIRQSAGQKVDPEHVDDEDLKLLALNGLMQSDSDRALPILEGLLQSNNAPKLKDRALFILSQSSSPKAYEMLSRIAKNGADPGLQRRAIRYIGLMGSERNSKLLADIYSSTSAADIKKSVLQAYMLSGNRAQLLAAARSEPNPELRSDAVTQLGLTGAREELAQLYTTESSLDVRKKILQAMFLGGNAEKLFDIARNEPNQELKLTAIRNIGLLGGDRAGEFLVSLYGSDTRTDVREAIVNSLFIEGDAKALVGLARHEQNRELKESIITKLGLMHSKEAVDYLMEYLK